MKTSWGGLIVLSWVFLFFAGTAPLASAAQPQQARVSQIIQDVRLLEAHTAPRPAVVNDKLILGTAVRTGVESRVELTFADLTITRLGANTIFTFSREARELELMSGAVLLEVPPNKAPVRVNTSAVTVGVTGGTALFATGPPTKFMVLEGTGTFYPAGHPEKAVTVRGGEMVMMTTDGHITGPEKFDVKLVIETSRLILDFPPLTNLLLILTVVNQQIAEQQMAGTTSQTLARNLVDVIDVTDQNANANPVVLASTSTQSPTPPPPTPPPPTPTPSKIGTLTVITSPVPYVITGGTVITTDPSITTNGVTDYGKIYRGPVEDGAFSLWAFGSTSAFDTALGVDNFFADPNHFPIAAFKFQSLSLNGNPTIDTSNGGVTKLALIGVDGITSGPPGGTLTFTGLDLLALGTVNGSINLTSDISFQDISVLAMYARGAGSNLILDSPISNIGDLKLGAEGSIQFTNPGTMNVGQFDATAGNNLTLRIGASLLLDGNTNLNTLVLPGTTVASGANLTLNIGNDLTNSSATDFSQLRVGNEGAHIGTGGNIAVSIGSDLTTGSDFSLAVQNPNGQIDNGGNITLTVDGSVSTGGQLSLLVENYDGTANPAGHIGTGGNISVTTAGDLTSDSIDAVINNRNGGTIGSPVSLTFNIGGALTTLENGTETLSSLFLAISNRYDNTFGSTIGGDATLALHADSASIGGILGVFLSDRGGTIDGNALLNFSITHDINVSGVDTTTANAAEIQLLNDSGPPGGAATPLGGTIHGDATLLLSATNLTVPAGSLDVEILNQNSGVSGPGGTIDSSANITFSLSGNFTTQTDASFAIRNNYAASGPGGIGGIGGTIGQDAVLNIDAISLSIGGALDTSIHNGRNAGDNGGTIGGNATINLVVVGGIAALHDSQLIGNGGGTIGSNAAITVSAASLATTDTAPGALSASINNNAGGSIGGSASINFDLSGNLTSASDANFLIDNSNGGMIGGAANVAINVDNNVTTLNGIDLQILNGNSGHIVTGADILYSVGGTTSTTDLTEYIDNSNGGAIDNGGTVTLHTIGPVMLDGGLLLEMDNFNGGTINNGADVTAHFVGDLTATLGSGHSFNFFVVNGDTIPSQGFTGGTIGTGGNIDLTFDGNAETTGTPDTGAFAAQISNIGGSIGTGGNISVAIGGNEANGNVLSIVIFNNQGHIETGGNITFHVAGDVTQVGSSGANFNLLNEGGTIGSSPVVDISAHNFSNAGNLFAVIDNSSAGMIGGDAGINFNISGGISTAGNMNVPVFNGGGGTIGGDATINVSAGNISVGTPLAPADLDVSIGNTSGTIGGGVATNLNVSGAITVAGAINAFLNNGGATSSPGSHITGDATINVLGATGINAGNGAFFAIVNEDAGAGTFGGTIDGNALVRVTADHLSTEALAPSDFNLFGTIHNRGGTIGGNSDVMFDIAGAITTAGRANFDILNFDDGGVNGGGIIGGNAMVSVSANSLTTTQGDAGLSIFNGSLGSIGGSAIISLNLTGDLAAQGNANFAIGNQDQGIGGGTIGSDATINVSAANISANSLLAQIDNTGGSIGGTTEGGATINMNVSGTATVTNDATVAIYGSDGAAGGAAININGGNYNVGRTFLSYIDGDGTITFNNASAHADVLKAGVFGANGVLNVGGGMLLADSTLKLYAPGSNGQLNFISNVTLGGNSAKILAANSVTIFNNIVVTIGGPNPADVYTNNANYSGFGGNGTTTGTFAGAGANNPQPLSNAPPFGPASPAKVATGGNITSRTRTPPSSPSTVTTGGNIADVRRASNVINVRSSDELLSLLDGAVPSLGGRLKVPPHNHRQAVNNDRLNVNRMIKGDRDMADIRHMHDRGAINNRLGSGTRAF